MELYQKNELENEQEQTENNSEQRLSLIESPEVEEKNNRFIVAQEMELFDSQGRRIKKWKGIVNEDNTEQMFSIVGRGYKIAQHDEVMDSIKESIENLELTYEDKVLVLNEGARIQVVISFPNINQKLSNGKELVLRITFDNSYDSTTGLRMNLTALTEKGNVLHTTNGKATYYHRHTKGMDTRNLTKKLEKGIDTFKNTIVAEFQKMLESELNISTVLNFLDKSIKEKVISVKYLEMIKAKLAMTPRDEINNQFDLYNLISEVLSAQVESIDAQKRHMETLYSKVKNL